MSFALILMVFMSCGSESKTKTSSPKDLNFSSINTPEDYSDMVLKAISSYRGSIVGSKIQAEKEIDQARLKRTSNMYAEAMVQKEWIREDDEIIQNGNKFEKSYKWLDKRRRVAMNIIINTTKRGNEISLDKISFKSNLDILDSVDF